MAEHEPTAARPLLRGLPDWLLPAALFLLLAAASISPSTYFLHLDTATQHIAAYDLLQACWGYTAATLAPMVLLAGPFAVFGAHPAIEMVLLSLLGAGMAAAFYRLAATQLGSRRWALAGALWFVALPSVLYYTRMHIGYPLAFFTIGVMLHAERRYVWAGAALGLAFTSHFNAVIPVALWLGWAFLLDRDTRRIGSLAKLAGGLLAPLVLLEAARFLFTGVVFGWVREEIDDAVRLSAQGDGSRWPVWHLLRFVGFANGWPSLAVLVSGLAYPLVRRKGRPLLDAAALAGWSLMAFYSLRVSVMANTFLTPRMFAAAYPLLAWTALATLHGATRWLRTRLTARQAGLLAGIGAVVVLLALPVWVLDNTLDAAAGTRTAYPTAEAAIEEATEAGLPVRYFGAFTSALSFGQRHHAEMQINELDPAQVVGDTRAVLIFEGADHPMLTALQADPRIDPAAYTITTVPHRTAYRPAAIEDYGVGPRVVNRLARQAFAREAGAEVSELVVWWPRDPQGTFEARQKLDEYIFYYPGGGCVSPRGFGEAQDRNYYDLLADKAREIGRLLGEGDVRGVGQAIRSWLEN